MIVDSPFKLRPARESSYRHIRASDDEVGRILMVGCEHKDTTWIVARERVAEKIQHGSAQDLHKRSQRP